MRSDPRDILSLSCMLSLIAFFVSMHVVCLVSTWELQDMQGRRMRMGNVLQASRGLLSCLPEYDALLEEGPTGQAAWLSNSVLASRMQFLMGILAPCVLQLPQVWQQLGCMCLSDGLLPASSNLCLTTPMHLLGSLLVPLNRMWSRGKCAVQHYCI